MSKESLQNLLSKLKTPIQEENSKNNILLIDGMNLFLRCFSTVQTRNKTGEHVGGVLGTLYSLGSVIKNTSPNEVIMIFDGENSSHSRKNIYPQYKANRHERQVCNFSMFDNLEQEKNAKESQLFRFIDYLQCLPIKMICIDNYEGDDIISYLTKKLETDNDITICSTDNDFIQLLNPNVKIYNPNSKQFFNEQKVFEKYQIYPINFLLHRILTGDNSDNIPNVNGFQLKTLLKYFPQFLENRKVTITELYEYCEEKLKEKKPSIKYSNVLNSKSIININTQLMDLTNIFFTDIDVLQIEQALKLNKKLLPMDFYKLIKEDQMEELLNNPLNWIGEIFSRLNK
jgi:5'-3' exonuclease